MSEPRDDRLLARVIAETAHPLDGGGRELDPLLALIGDARCVLIGEATHGTHEFYRLRAELTKRLIVEKGFQAVAAEADWADAHRVDRYVRGLGEDADALEALADFRRFPAWMWRNADVLDFVGWLSHHNEAQRPVDRVGFYGLDLYGLEASREAVVRYLEEVDPDAARRARDRYACFDAVAQTPEGYGHATALELTPGCEREVLDQLRELLEERGRSLRAADRADGDAHFAAEQNARVVKDAEAYYRTMFHGRVSSWNLRDGHMADTLDALLVHLEGKGSGGGKVVVWAHNSHVGDARATSLARIGELSLGELARVRHPGEVRLLGFTTHQGTVTAATDWDGVAERRRVRAALPESYEALFHAVGMGRFALDLTRLGEAAGGLAEPRLQRAIGVVYRPETERASHYLEARLPEQFDAILHVDRTRATEPLERLASWELGEPPETYPTGL